MATFDVHTVTFPDYPLPSGNAGTLLVRPSQLAEGAAYAHEHDINSLRITNGLYAPPSRGQSPIDLDLTALRGCPNLEELFIDDIPLGKLDGLDALYELPLVALTIEAGVRIKTIVDFTQLARLERLYYPATKALRDAALPASLRSVTMVSPESLAPLGGLENLHTLELVRPKVTSLAGIGVNDALTDLKVFGARTLNDITAITRLPSLKRLEFEQCPQLTSDALSAAPSASLEQLRLRLTINDLRFVRHYPNLTTVYFRDVVDGDLTPLLKTSLLTVVPTVSMKHYRHTDRRSLRCCINRCAWSYRGCWIGNYIGEISCRNARSAATGPSGVRYSRR